MTQVYVWATSLKKGKTRSCIQKHHGKGGVNCLRLHDNCLYNYVMRGPLEKLLSSTGEGKGGEAILSLYFSILKKIKMESGPSMQSILVCIRKLLISIPPSGEVHPHNPITNYPEDDYSNYYQSCIERIQAMQQVFLLTLIFLLSGDVNV